jgi:microcompartment protein CcmL/EutN
MDCLALLELDSVARGYRALDALVKESPVTVIHANLVEPGKYLILFGGGVAECEAAFRVGKDLAADALLDQVFLPLVHAAIWPALRGEQAFFDPDSLGVIEGRSVAGVVEACDRSLKSADVALCGLRVVAGLGGKAFYVVHGLQHDVEAAIEAGVGVLGGRGSLHRAELIARPHPDFITQILVSAPFGGF